jgi:hypothetical protein
MQYDKNIKLLKKLKQYKLWPISTGLEERVEQESKFKRQQN